MLSVNYLDGGSENFHSEEIMFDERLRCFVIKDEDDDGNTIDNFVAIDNVRNVSITQFNA